MLSGTELFQVPLESFFCEHDALYSVGRESSSTAYFPVLGKRVELVVVGYSTNKFLKA